MPAKKTPSTEPTPSANKASARKSAVKKAPARKAAATKAPATTPAPATNAAGPPAEPVPAAALRPSRDQIAQAAYLNFLKRKERGLPGDPAGDWLDAERQLVGQE